MWKFKPFAQKEATGLEGRYLEVGNLKVHVRNVIAEGGFSSVYLAQDTNHTSKQYALKHIICNDEESLELVMKEISVLKSLKGHPNIVKLYAHGILDMGRNKKEALLAMEFCGKSLVEVLEKRGVGYFEEKQAFAIFRDVCNAVFAMHCQSPCIAHRDLKAENILLSSDGEWKLCDFGSVSTNHKRFERAEEMGIEEDNIRKYTTPTYRAPEMWDLFRREIICEKVDIWALGCLLFRICYFKNAFDGESKLQILNGNYRIPESPKFSSSVTDLIKEMLQASPENRPDITEIWFRVNEQLPANLQKSLPDQPPEMQPGPRRTPPPPPSYAESASGGPLWENTKFDEPNSSNFAAHETMETATINRRKVTKDDDFNSFVADFDTAKLDNGHKPGKEEILEAEIVRLKEELKQTNSDKAEITAKFEKLSAICRLQRQELQDVKLTLASKTANIENQTSPEMHSSSSDLNSWQPFSDESKSVLKSGSIGNDNSVNKSVRTRSKLASSSLAMGSQGFEPWGFETELFRAATPSLASVSSGKTLQGIENSKIRDNQKSGQPAGWAGF